MFHLAYAHLTKPINVTGLKVAIPIISHLARNINISTIHHSPTPGIDAPMPPKPARSPTSKQLAVPRPSASVLLISPTNQILLLHRVRTSSAFPSAHVFPGGNISTFHDGDIPAPDSPLRHEDGLCYRLAAIRETFEESGILLAVNKRDPGRLVEVEEQEREGGRKAIHGEEVGFRGWVDGVGGVPDVDGLIPFTRWVTPPNVPRRFTTQMYIYFLPLASSPSTDPIPETTTPKDHPSLIPTPTTDGGIEHTAARFAHAQTWLDAASTGEIILFPPQYLLLHLIAPFLTLPPPPPTSQILPPRSPPPNRAHLQAQRARLLAFTATSTPPWTHKCISPTQILRRRSDGRAVLGLDKPGLELVGSERAGESERVVLVDFAREGPRRVEVKGRREVLEEERGMGRGEGGRL